MLTRTIAVLGFGCGVALALLGRASDVAAQATPAPAWRLVEEWRVGGEVDGAHSFADPRALERLPNGGFAIVDFKDQQVHLLGPRGEIVRTVGRRGAGPGEYRNANGLLVLPSGDIVVNDPHNTRFTVLAPTGELRRSVPVQMWGWTYLWDAWVHKGRLHELIAVRADGARSMTQMLRRWSPDLSSADTVASPSCQSAPSRPPEASSVRLEGPGGGSVRAVPFLSPVRRTAVVPGRGEIWVGNGHVNELLRVEPGHCTPLGTARLGGRRPPVTAAERREAEEGIRNAAAKIGAAVPDLSVIPREKPWFDDLLADATGNVWVLRSDERGATRGEVHGPDGRLLATLPDAVPFQRHRPHLITATHAYGFVADDDGLLSLAAWRIVR